jgi:hypothetical protein
MKPTGTFKSLFEAHPRSKNPKETMSGNLKKRPASRGINVQFTEDQIEQLEAICEEENIPRNKFVVIAVEHYLSSRKK